MNAKDLGSFRNCGNFIDVSLKGRSKTGYQALLAEQRFGNIGLDEFGCTYFLALKQAIPRLNGESDIIYIGQTENLRIRLSDYGNRTETQEKHLWDIINRLVSRGEFIQLFICIFPPEDMSYKDYEDKLLAEFLEQHWELPPFNFQKGRKAKKRK